MKRLLAAVSLSVVAILTLWAFAAAAADTEACLQHSVKKGETVSLICIDYYGHYSNAMGAAVRKLNPDLKDINLIRVGQKLKLRDPKTPKSAAPEAAVLEKRINATQGVVTYVEGTAFVTAKGTAKRMKLSANTVVGPGDVLQTGKDGRVELIVNRESVVRMRENSRLALDAIRDNDRKDGKTAMTFSLGTVWAKVRRFSDKVSRFQLDLPTAVAGVHGTTYQTSVGSDKSAEVRVYDGEVAVSGQSGESVQETGPLSEVPGPQEVPGPHEVTMEEWVHIVRSMQRIRIDSEGRASEPKSFKKVADDWEKWNEERDERVAEMFAREF